LKVILVVEVSKDSPTNLDLEKFNSSLLESNKSLERDAIIVRVVLEFFLDHLLDSLNVSFF
jgi:hypothetical protein